MTSRPFDERSTIVGGWPSVAPMIVASIRMPSHLISAAHPEPVGTRSVDVAFIGGIQSEVDLDRDESDTPLRVSLPVVGDRSCLPTYW